MRIRWLSPFLMFLALLAGSSFGLENEYPNESGMHDAQEVVDAPDNTAVEAALAKERVRVLAPKDYPPFAFVDNQGRLTGIARDLIDLAAEGSDLELEFKETELDAIPEAIARRDGDVALLVTDPPGPGNAVITTRPFMESLEAIITQRDKVGIHRLTDLRGSAVSVVEGGPAMANLAAVYPDVKILPRKSVPEALQDVASGEVMSYVGPLGTATFYMQKHLLAQLKVAGLVQDRMIRFKIGVRSDGPQLLDKLQQGLDSIDDSQRQALIGRYFAPDVASGISLAFSLTPHEREWLKAHSEIRLGVNGAWSPLESVGPDGQHRGISSEYTQIAGDLLGIKMVPVQEDSWIQTLQAARERKIDVIALFAKSPEREAFLLFTEPYLVSQGVVVTRKDAPPLNGLKDLEGKRVSVVAGEIAEEHIAVKYPEIDLVRVNTVEEGLRTVVDGKAAGFIESMTVATHALSSLNLDVLKIAASCGFPYEYGMGVRRDWPELVAFLDEALGTVSGLTRTAIQDRWTGIPMEHRTDRGFLWKVLGLAASIGGTILVVILFWNRRLSREVAVRKQADEKIRDQAALLSGLLDSIPDMIFFKNVSGVYLGCNPAFSRFVNRSRDAITGCTDFDLLEKEAADVFREHDREVVKIGKPKQYEDWVIPSDGDRIFLEISKAPLRDGTGRITGVLGVARDITALKLADELRMERSVGLEALERVEKPGLRRKRFRPDCVSGWRRSHDTALTSNSWSRTARKIYAGARRKPGFF